jgi:hypothetical protein
MSNTEVGKLILSVGAELGRTPEQMQPIIQKLVEDQWYETFESLRGLSDEQWERLSLPGRLVQKLRERIAEEPPALEPMPGLEIAPPSVFEAPSVPLHALMESIYEELKDSPDQLCECVRTLTRIVSNVLVEPSNIKYRLLKTDSVIFQKSISCSQTAVRFIEWLGFSLEGNTYRCSQVYLGRFTDAQTELVKRLSLLDPNFKLPQPTTRPPFNPFKASFTNAGDTFGAPKGQVLEEREAEMHMLRQQAIEIKAKLPSSQGTPLEPPKLISLTNISGSSASSRFAEAGDDDTSLLLASMRSIAAAGETAQKFRSREKAELERIRNRPVFASTRVRVAFADKKALELLIVSTETVSSLYQIVSKYVRTQLRGSADWDLVVTPPPRRLDRKSLKSMVDEDFAPSVTLRMTLRGNPCNSFDVLHPDLIV